MASSSSSSSEPIRMFNFGWTQLQYDAQMPEKPEGASISGETPVVVRPEASVNIQDEGAVKPEVKERLGLELDFAMFTQAIPPTKVAPNVLAKQSDEVDTLLVKGRDEGVIEPKEASPPAKVEAKLPAKPVEEDDLKRFVLCAFVIGSILTAIILGSFSYGVSTGTSIAQPAIPIVNPWTCDDDSDLPSIVCSADPNQQRRTLSLKSAFDTFISVYRRRLSAAEDSLALATLMHSQKRFVARSPYDVLVWRDEVYVLKRAISMAELARGHLDAHGTAPQYSVDIPFSLTGKGWVSNSVAYQHLHHELLKYNVLTHITADSIYISSWTSYNE